MTLAYAVELESVCVGTADGALVLLRADGAAVEQVGSVAGGVAAAAWSPGGDVLLVITGHGILLLMNQASMGSHAALEQGNISRLLNLAAQPAASGCLSLRQQQSVHSGAHTATIARLLVQDFEVLAEADISDDSVGVQQPLVTAASIAWRGDGNYVATLVDANAAPLPESDGTSGEQHATMRVWEGKSLQLHAEGEAAAALSATAAWQSNGRHLYAAQHAGLTPRVLLFELNGLQHGGFDLYVPGAPSVVVAPCNCILKVCW